MISSAEHENFHGITNPDSLAFLDERDPRPFIPTQSVIDKLPSGVMSDSAKQAALDYDRAKTPIDDLVQKGPITDAFNTDPANKFSERAADSGAASLEHWAKTKSPDTARIWADLTRRFENAALRQNAQFVRKGILPRDSKVLGTTETANKLKQMKHQTDEASNR